MKNKKQIQEDKALLDALSPVVNNIIDNNYENSKEKIASQMAPIMGSIIKRYITKNLKNMLNSIKKRKLHPLIYILPILFLLFGIWGWYGNSTDNSITKKTNEIMYKTPQLTIYRITTNSDGGTLTLKGEVPFEYHKSLAQNLVEEVDGVKDIKNEIMVVSSLDDPMQISSNIHYLLNGLNSDAGVNLKYNYNYPSLKISGTTWDKTRKNSIINQLKKIDGVKNIINDIKVVVPDIKTILYFKRGVSKVSKNQEKTLIELISLLKQLDSNVTVNVKGYSDNIGTHKANKKIVLNRARSVANFLKERGSIKQKIKIFGINKINKKRCAIITLEN